MADFETSLRRFVWDPAGVDLELLGFGDKMLSQPTQVQSRRVQVQDYFRAKFVDTFDRGGLQWNLSFNKVWEFSTIQEALNFKEDHDLAIADLIDAPLYCYVQGGKTYKYAAAAMQSYSTEDGGGLLGVVPRVVCYYEVVASQKREVT